MSVPQIFTNFMGKQLCQSLLFNEVTGRPEACNFNKKKALTQVSSCEFCENLKNNLFHRTPNVAASDIFPVLSSMTYINPFENVNNFLDLFKCTILMILL